MLKQPRILVLRGGAIGDFLMTLPALQAMREQWPDAHIELVGYPHIAELARTGKTIDASRSLDEAGMARLFSKRPDFEDHQLSYLRSFDMVFSYLHDPCNTVISNIERIGVKKVIQGSPLVTDCHAVDHLLKPLLPGIRSPSTSR